MWTALDLLFPSRCCGCDDVTSSSRRWCAACRSELSLEALSDPIEGIRVGYAAARYDSAIGRALVRAKYGRDHGLMLELGSVFSRTIAPIAHGASAIVAVPSPWPRRLHRGFSPASVLAQALSAATGLPNEDVLELKRGARQAGMRSGTREKNMSGRLRAWRDLPGQVILVDDVVTTGATAKASARELLGGCTVDVTLAVLACAKRSPLHDCEDP